MAWGATFTTSCGIVQAVVCGPIRAREATRRLMSPLLR